jgi:opacity protein-like surface antigen
MRRIRLCVLAVALAAAAAACDTTDPTLTATTPSSPTNPTVENFNGTVSAGSADSHSFTVLLNGGTLSVTLTAAGPPSNVTVGLGIGNSSGGICTPFQNSAVATTAGTTPQLSGPANAGTYCVTVFDAGGAFALPGTINYAVSVAHY